MKRRHPHRMYGIALGMLLIAAAANASARIDVYTTAGEPVTHVPANAHVIELDKPSRLDHRLSQDLPSKPKAAAAEVRRRLGHFRAAYGRAYRGLERAYRLGVTKVPAIVVDGQYVVYGQPDVARALKTIRAAHPSEAVP